MPQNGGVKCMDKLYDLRRNVTSMERILANEEADGAYKFLDEQDKSRINNDKIRFGEYFIACSDDQYHRIDPINVVEKGGQIVGLDPDNLTII